MKRNLILGLIGWLVFCCLGNSEVFSDDWSFLGASDTRDGNGLQHALQWASANLINPSPVFLVEAGDLDPIPRKENIVATYFGKPVFLSMGNHDKDHDRQYYYKSFYLGKKLPYLVDSTFIEQQGAEALLFSFAYENAYFIILDQYYQVPFQNYGNVKGKQLEWLKNQLIDNPYPYIFVIGHEPAYPKSWQRNYGDCLDRTPEDRDRFWQVLSQYEVTAYLCGHTHSYLKQHIQNVWHIDMGHCYETDHHNKILNFIVSEDSVQVNVHLPNGKLHDQFRLMPRNVAHPVELTLFSYKIIDKQVNLTWHTATETNNFGFEIHKSWDKINFNRIGFVPGQGTTQNPQAYCFSDQLSVPATYYYRLQQIDYNGDFHFSKTLEVSVDQIENFQLVQIYPNPFNQQTVISYGINDDAFVTLKIYNSRGQLIESLINGHQSAGNYQAIWPATNPAGQFLPSGIYLCRLSVNGKQMTMKMMLTR